MNLPGFRAEASLYKTSEQYRMSVSQDPSGSQTKVFPQRWWGSACDQQLNQCIENCYIVDMECVNQCYLDYYMCVLPPFP